MSGWTDEENKQLAELWPTQFSACAAMFPRHSLKAVRQQAQVIGVALPKWTKKDERKLAELWPAMGSNCASAFPGRTKSAVRGKAQELGVKRASLARGLTFAQMARAA